MRNDIYTPLETGIEALLDKVDQQHQDYPKVLVWKQRLTFNISASRVYGDTADRRTERAEIVDQLNRFALSLCNYSFDELCVSPPATEPQTSDQPYRYDVFLSYANGSGGLFGEWTHRHFFKLFKLFLEDALGRQPDIFLDRLNEHSQVADQHWPTHRKDALAMSRCLVAIWSPSYFASSWCLREFLTMRHREYLLRYRTAEHPGSLIFPVTISDGTRFPDTAKERIPDQFDCRNFMRIGDAFERTLRYIEFQDTMNEWVKRVAHAIEQAPPLQQDWLSIDIDIDIDVDSLETRAHSFPLPGLE